jgi:hypothetical protein
MMDGPVDRISRTAPVAIRVHYAHFYGVRIFVYPQTNPQMDVSYPAPVDQLLTLGEPEDKDWPDYRALGISDEHVPALIELLLDERIAWPAYTEGEVEAQYSAHLHAWRALGQLGAEAAVEPLLRRLALEGDGDVANDEIPRVLAMIGPAALGPVRDALPGAAAEPQPWTAVSLSQALKEIATAHPQARDEAVAAITSQLQSWRDQDLYINTFLISNLLDLKAVEAAHVIEAALAGRVVDTSVTGDWEDVQVELGLLAERITPLPRYDHGLGDDWLETFDDFATEPVRAARPKPAPPPPPAHPAAKASKLRKAQKKASRRRRK